MQNKKKHVIRFGENEKFLDVRFDIVFKAVFTRDTPSSRGALSSLISTLIGRVITVKTINPNEPAADNTHERGICFDIDCTAQDGERINVEMSLNPAADELARMEYYEARLFGRQDIRGTRKKFANLKEAFQITILGKKQFFNDAALVHTFEYYDPTHGVSLDGRTRIITMELCKAWRSIEKPVEEMRAEEEWAAFFGYLTNGEKREKINAILAQEEGIAMAGETLTTISDDDMEWMRQESKLRRELHYQGDMALAREEGHIAGHIAGHAAGHIEGIRETAKNLKLAGASLDLIAKATGLTPEEITGL